MANDETKTALDDASVAAVRFMLDKLADHDVAEIYERLEGRDLSPISQPKRCRPATSIFSGQRCVRA
jgi:hypothetical protein